MGKEDRNRGFTLIELLVVVGVLAALAAILVPNVARFVGYGREEGATLELKRVQSAMDAAIAENGLRPGVTIAPGTDVVDFGTAPIDTGGGIYLYPNYLRQLQDAKYGPYDWDDSGKITVN